MHVFLLGFLCCRGAVDALSVSVSPRLSVSVAEGSATAIDSGARVWDSGRVLAKQMAQRAFDSERVVRHSTHTDRH
jgi:hypothetical protein